MHATLDHSPNQEAPPSGRMRRTSVVIPAKNEAANIGWVLQHLPDSVDEVVLVDGHSTDDTIAAARRARPDVVVVIDGIPGKGAALRTGVAAATGDDVVMLDADGSMDPRELDRFLVQLRAGYDLVKGSRFMPSGGTADMTPLRDLGNRGLLLLANVLFRTRHTDLCYGYAAFRREAFDGLALTADGFEIEAQLFLRAHRRGLRVTEVPSFEAPRRFGNSNLNTFRDGWRVLQTIIRERLRRVPRTRTSSRPSRRVAGRASVLPAIQIAAGLVPVTNADSRLEGTHRSERRAADGLASRSRPQRLMPAVGGRRRRVVPRAAARARHATHPAPGSGATRPD